VQKSDINSTTYATGLGFFSKMKYFLETLPPSFRIASNSRYKTLNYTIIKYLIDNPFGWNDQGIMWEANYLKKSANHRWKSTEIRQKLQFFFICLSLKPHKIQMKQGKKVCKATALRCYQCFSLQFLLSCWQQQSGCYQYQNSYTGELLTAPERNKKITQNFKSMVLDSYINYIFCLLTILLNLIVVL